MNHLRNVFNPTSATTKNEGRNNPKKNWKGRDASALEVWTNSYLCKIAGNKLLCFVTVGATQRPHSTAASNLVPLIHASREEL